METGEDGASLRPRYRSEPTLLLSLAGRADHLRGPRAPRTCTRRAGRAGGRRPTARKLIDLFEDVQRHELSAGRRLAVVFTTKSSRPQRRILRLSNMRGAYKI